MKNQLPKFEDIKTQINLMAKEFGSISPIYSTMYKQGALDIYSWITSEMTKANEVKEQVVIVNEDVLLADIKKLEDAIADPKLAFRKKMNENYLMVLKNKK